MSKVYFAKDPFQADKLFDAAGFDKIINRDDAVALKIHFGEPGNTAYLKPSLVRGICEKVKACGGKPFYTDCNALYKGPRQKTEEHLRVAGEHGYTRENAGAEAIIPAENDCAGVTVNLKHFKTVHLGGTAVKAKVIIALTHFKGHELTGFGGALKNLGMGFGTRLGKLRMHQECKNCPEAKTCRKNQTIEACWVGSPAIVQEKIAEYAFGAVQDKKNKTAYFNFITDVSPACDCYGHNGPPIVPDIGALASFDPVAIDQASADLINQAGGKDMFRALYPAVDWEVQLNYAAKIGLGSRTYELVLK